MSQYFKGYLAGLSILRGKTESDRVIRCLNDCKEKLDFHAMSEMETGMVNNTKYPHVFSPFSVVHVLTTNHVRCCY